MIINLTEVCEQKGNRDISSREPYRKTFELRDVFINPEHIVCLREATGFSKLLAESDLVNTSINPRGSFTRVSMNRGQTGIDLVVVGTAQEIRAAISENQKTFYLIFLISDLPVRIWGARESLGRQNGTNVGKNGAKSAQKSSKSILN